MSCHFLSQILSINFSSCFTHQCEQNGKIVIITFHYGDRCVTSESPVMLTAGSPNDSHIFQYDVLWEQYFTLKYWEYGTVAHGQKPVFLMTCLNARPSEMETGEKIPHRQNCNPSEPHICRCWSHALANPCIQAKIFKDIFWKVSSLRLNFIQFWKLTMISQGVDKKVAESWKQ